MRELRQANEQHQGVLTFSNSTADMVAAAQGVGPASNVRCPTPARTLENESGQEWEHTWTSCGSGSSGGADQSSARRSTGKLVLRVIRCYALLMAIRKMFRRHT